MFLWKKDVLDERFAMHRLYATRLAAVVTAVFTGAWVLYDLLANQVERWDLLAILIVMAVAKVGAMAYYRLTN